MIYSSNCKLKHLKPNLFIIRKLFFYFFSLTLSVFVLNSNAQDLAWPKTLEVDIHRDVRAYHGMLKTRIASLASNPAFRSDINPANNPLISSFETQFGEHWDKFQPSELESVTSPIQSLDSIITLDYDETNSQWINDVKEEFGYDINGNLSMGAYYEWDESTKKWIGDEKVEFGFDMYGNFTLVVYYYWDESTEQWTIDEGGEIDIEYDANGNITVMIFYYEDETTNQRMTEAKEEFTYDENGNQILDIYSYWDETSSQWVNEEKKEFTYDDHGNQTLYVLYSWDETTSQWLSSEREEFTYDENGNQTLYISSYWDEDSYQWVNDDKEQFTYDDKGNQTLYSSYGWDESSSQWVLFVEREYAYDENDNQILIQYCGDFSGPNGPPDGIIECNKVVSTYDSNGNKTSVSEYSQVDSNSPWIIRSKLEWFYDEFGNPVMKLTYYEGEAQAKSVATYDLSYKMSDIIMPSSEWDISFNLIYTANKLLETIRYSWDKTSNSWIYENKVIYCYSGESHLSKETDILSYNFSSPPQIGNSMINTETHLIKVKVGNGTDISNMVATFEFSEGAIAKVGGVLQECGITSNDFTSPVIYEVIAEDGITKQDWVVSVEVAVGIENTKDSTLLIYMPFNGDAEDKSIYQFKTAFKGGTFIENLHGYANSALYLDTNVDQFEVLPDERLGLEEFTVSFWFKTDAFNDQEMTIMFDTQYYLDYGWGFVDGGPNSQIVFQTSGNNGAYECKFPRNLLTENTWHLLTGTYKNNEMNLYLDTVLMSTTTDALYVPAYNSSIHAGFWDGTYEYKGAFDEFRMYSRVLEQKEISRLYNDINYNLNLSFDADIKYGRTPVAVSFSNQTDAPNPIVAWKWDFDNDGIIDSEDMNPTFTYTSPGHYDVKLIASDGIRTDSLVRKYFIDVYESSELPEEVAYIPFDGSVVDVTGNAADLFCDSPEFEADRNSIPDRSIHFRGDHKIVDLTPGEKQRVDGEFTVSIWVKTSSFDGEEYVTIAGTGTYAETGWVIGDNGYWSDDILFRVNDENGAYDCSFKRERINDNGWHLLTGVYKQPVSYFYLDTLLVSVNEAAFYLKDTIANIGIGLNRVSGNCDEFRLYDKAIDLGQIRELYFDYDLYADFTSDVREGIEPLTVSFEDISLPVDSATVWSWDFNNDGITDSESREPVFIYESEGIYDVRLIVANEQSADTIVKSDFIVVFKDCELNPDFAADTVYGVTPFEVSFTDLSQPQDCITDWKWDMDNDGIIDNTSQNPIYVFIDTGYHTVKLIIESEYKSDTIIKENLIHVIGEANLVETFQSSYSIYPNPANEYVIIEGLRNEPAEIEVVSADGRILIHELIHAESVRLSLTGIPDGVYFLKIKSKEQSNSYKVIKQLSVGM